ncbi:DUF6473 family protein [Roseicyclus persicicus]|uniref:DUF6473 domain-containing protein n=1 Tax=Roseicyclus persicicus TaxID=2650661 RepID=A0A7X6GV76_9RHOB|nr:DUF6473 family protein [Roseibacterium persicicum]NKX42980.1 hypothetical protein [Roseibacterium persicicum]
MSFEQRGPLPLDYQPVSYPGSVLRFRGPGHALEPPYVLCLGGTETFGRFIPLPYATQLDAALPAAVVNMGVMNAGLDVLMHDPAIRAATAGAAAVVLQVTGAQNMSNRFYAVHPRRNDRFVKATAILRTVYRDVDFTEFHYTRHLLTHLRALSADRFGIVEAELRTAWVARMKGFLGRTAAPVHLMWLSRRAPGDAPPAGGLGADPVLVTAAMLEEVTPLAASLTVAVAPPAEGPAATRGMFYAPREEAAARALPGPEAHDLAAALLRDRLG